MSNALVDLLLSGNCDFIDLGQPLNEETLIIQLPEPFVNTPGFSREVISQYDDKGPAWYWNTITLGEHVGTHFDAPTHWVTGKDNKNVDEIPAADFIGEAIVFDLSQDAKTNPDRLLTVDDILAFEKEHGKVPARSWCVIRSGWGQYAQDPKMFFNVGDDGMPHTPGPSKDAVVFLIEERDILGLCTETVGTDAGIAGTFDPMYPAHNLMHGAGKYGLTQLNNVDKLPPRGAIIVALPLKITGGSGSPVRPMAIVPK